MAQTVQRKQKRKKPSVVEAQDSTPPAPKRARVAQAQTARKSTGGREPSHRSRGGDDGDDDGGDDDDDGDGDGGDGRGGAPRAGPSRQRMLCTPLRPADLASLVLGGETGHIDASVPYFFFRYRPKLCVRSRRARKKTAVQTGHGRPSRNPEVSEEYGLAPAQAPLCARGT
jgi:hypothetical protein